MLKDEDVKRIITALNKKFEKEKEKHEGAIKQTQELCKHTTSVRVMTGAKCELCGKITMWAIH